MCVIFANGLVQRGVDTRLVVLDLRDAAYAHLLDPRVQVVSFDIPHARNAIGGLTAYLRETRPTCCYSFASLLTTLLILLRGLHHFPITIIGEQHNNLTIQQQSYRHSWWYGHIAPAIRRTLYTRADHVVAVAEGVRLQLLRDYGFSEERVSTIYNGVDPHLQQRAAASPRTPSPSAMYAIGRLHYQKGYDRLIAAFALCHQQRPDLQLHIVGEGDLREPLQHQIDQIGLAHAITLHGFEQDIARIYPHIPVLAMSSHFEALPSVLVEANTFGVPVVAFDCDYGPAEIIEDGVNGFLVPQDDIPALAQALLRALETEWDTEQIKATARRFSADTMVEAKLDLLQRLCPVFKGDHYE